MSSTAAHSHPPRTETARKPVIDLFMHQFGDRGGMERSTLRVVEKLVARGWKINVYSYGFDDCTLPNVNWKPVKGASLPTALLKLIWFWQANRRASRPKPDHLCVTMGAITPFSECEILQYVHAASDHLISQGKLVLPNDRTFFHRAYQFVFAKFALHLEHLGLRRTQAVLAISESVRADVLRFYPGVPVVTAHHAVPAVPRAQWESKWKKVEKARFLFVGTFERKGLEKALEALAGMKDLPWEFTVLGEGNFTRFQKRARELQIADRVQWKGKTPADPYFLSHHVLLFPSQYEPYGLVVGEAAAAGCVPLASRECGAMELWKGRPEWLKLSAEDSVESWTKSARRLVLELVTKTPTLAEEAQRQLCEHTWDKAADIYEQLFLDLARKKQGNEIASGPSGPRNDGKITSTL